MPAEKSPAASSACSRPIPVILSKAKDLVAIASGVPAEMA
jgi:hypothetical protein